MQQVITWELAMIIIAIIGAVAGAWWRVESRVEDARRDVHTAAMAASAQASLALQQLAEFRLHVAETYASKSGMREMSERVMRGQDDLKGELSRLTERIDRLMELQAPRQRSSP